MVGRTVGAVLVAAGMLVGVSPASAFSFDALISRSQFGQPGNGASLTPVLSSDGRYVAFSSEASNLVRRDGNGVSDVFVKDRYAGSVNRVSVTTDGRQGDAASYDPPGISADGRIVAFVSNATNLVSGDTNGNDDVLVKNLRTGALTMVSAAADGTPGNGASYGS